MDDSDQTCLLHVQVIRFGQSPRWMPLLEDSRNDYQEAGHGQSRRNKFEVAKKIFNLTMSHIAEGGPFDDLYDGFANGRCECSCDDDRSEERRVGKEGRS